MTTLASSFSIKRIKIFVMLWFVCSCAVASAQQKITGVVTGIDNAPIYGASVLIKKTGAATSTDKNGFFTIPAKPNDIIIVSFVGYETKETQAGNGEPLRIVISPLIANLNDVIVTGYTAQKIKEITGSVAVVNPKQLKEVPAGQVEQMLQGRVAGLTVITSGMPGGGSNIRLHGIGNFGDVTPLYIIDGIQGDINSINPYDIESLQVLKDAGAYAIYGVRGANGVILVTTKKGKAGKTKLSYNFYVGKQYPLKKRKDV